MKLPAVTVNVVASWFEGRLASAHELIEKKTGHIEKRLVTMWLHAALFKRSPLYTSCRHPDRRAAARLRCASSGGGAAGLARHAAHWLRRTAHASRKSMRRRHRIRPQRRGPRDAGSGSQRMSVRYNTAPPPGFADRGEHRFTSRCIRILICPPMPTDRPIAAAINRNYLGDEEQIVRALADAARLSPAQRDTVLGPAHGISSKACARRRSSAPGSTRSCASTICRRRKA